MYFMSWMVGILVLTMVIGQFPTLILFVLLYLVFWGKFSWKVVVLYLVGIIVFLLGMFNEIVPVMWYEPDWLPNFFV